jgi:hypothetical protein
LGPRHGIKHDAAAVDNLRMATPPRIRLRLGIPGLLALLGACNGGEADSYSTPAQAPAMHHGIALTNLQIADMLYPGTRRVPADFLNDTPPPDMGVVATYHLQNTHLTPSAERHELCTDDWNQAREWSNTASGSTEILVGESATERYFEFLRVRSGTPAVNVRARVYRCAYLDRSAANAATEQGSAGVLNQRPIDAAALRTLSEYLWTFTSYNNADQAVLASIGAPQDAGFGHEIVQAQLLRTSSGSCDRILVSTWRHRVDSATGMLTREWEPLWEFGARQDAGRVTTSC